MHSRLQYYLHMVVVCVYSSYAVDSESSLKMMKMLLKKLDVIADTAENGRIAVDMILGAADTEPYHLVLMDNLMPEMVIHTLSHLLLVPNLIWLFNN